MLIFLVFMWGVQVILVGAPAHKFKVMKEFGIDHTIKLEEFFPQHHHLMVIPGLKASASLTIKIMYGTVDHKY